MKKIKLIVVLCMMLLMGLYTGSIYANDTNEGYNIEVKSTTDKDGKTVEYLASVDDDGYLRITQILQNSQNVKINTSTYEGNLLISGKAEKDTELTIKVYNGVDESEEASTYENIKVGTTETFSQSVEVQEGYNTIVITYSNEEDKIDNYITFYVTRGSVENMEAIKTYLVVPSI